MTECMIGFFINCKFEIFFLDYVVASLLRLVSLLELMAAAHLVSQPERVCSQLGEKVGGGVYVSQTQCQGDGWHQSCTSAWSSWKQSGDLCSTLPLSYRTGMLSDSPTTAVAYINRQGKV